MRTSSSLPKNSAVREIVLVPEVRNEGLLESALYYASKGFSVLPVKAGRKAPPYVPDWPNRASTDRSVIQRWWKKHPKANVAIVTGMKYELLVLDVDPRNGGDVTMRKLKRKHGALPRTLVAYTPSGGRHYFFKVDRPIKSSVSKLGPGVDVRCEGGYVVVAPSIVGGNAYAWSN